MRKNFGAKTWLYPMPVFIIGAYDESGKPNLMNAAWGGVSEEHQVSVCISADHKTTENIKTSGAFTISMATAGTVVPCDYVGLVSGNDDPDKTAKTGFTFHRSEFVNAPIVCELPMCVECRLISYDPDTCILIGDIVNVSVDEACLGEDGKPSVEKLRPITYDGVHHFYREIGAAVGRAFSDGLALK